MRSVERARKWIHKGNEDTLFTGKDQEDWRGAKSWLHVIFNNPIAIFGLTLNKDEIFLRWLLIERAKYFAEFPERYREAWYISCNEKPDMGKNLFLRQGWSDSNKSQ